MYYCKVVKCVDILHTLSTNYLNHKMAFFAVPELYKNDKSEDTNIVVSKVTNSIQSVEDDKVQLL